MVKVPTINIKFFLHDRVKPTIQEGEEIYPLYIRVNFLRRGTQLPVLDHKGLSIYVSKEDFKFLTETAASWAKDGFNNLYSPERTIFSKEIILKKTIEQVFNEDKERTDFKKVVKLYRWYEQYTYVIVNAAVVPISANLVGRIDEMGEPYSLSKEEKLLIETAIAISSYWGDKRQLMGIYKPSTFGSVFHWLFEGGRNDFYTYLINAIDHPEFFADRANSRGISWEIIKTFPVKKESISEYLHIVENLINKVQE